MYLLLLDLLIIAYCSFSFPLTGIILRILFSPFHVLYCIFLGFAFCNEHFCSSYILYLQQSLRQRWAYYSNILKKFRFTKFSLTGVVLFLLLFLCVTFYYLSTWSRLLIVFLYCLCNWPCNLCQHINNIEINDDDDNNNNNNNYYYYYIKSPLQIFLPAVIHFTL